MAAIPNKRRFPIFVAALLLVGAATVILWLILDRPATGIDDADIFLVYARHLSVGDGFVFNAGGEHVEGFTSLLWVLICTVAVHLTTHPEPILLITSVVLLAIAITACLTSPIFKRKDGSSERSLPWMSAFAMLLLVDWRFMAWNTVTLMDTSLWCCLMTLTALIAIDDETNVRDAWILAVLTALSMIARPEAFLWVPVVLLTAYVRRHRVRGKAAALRTIAPAAACAAAAGGALIFFRMNYFGYPLPNTYYAKVSPRLGYQLTEGTTYLALYLLSSPVSLMAALAICVSIVLLCKTPRRADDDRTWSLIVLTLVALGMPVLNGGDHFAGFRFYQPAFPLLLLALVNTARFVLPTPAALPTAASIWSPPEKTLRRRVALLGIATVAASLVWTMVRPWLDSKIINGLRQEFLIASFGRERGETAQKLFGDALPRPSIGTITVGGIKHEYDGEIVDLMGLNDVRMAHNGGSRIGVKSHAAFEKKTFYERPPVILIPLTQFPNDLSGIQIERRDKFVDVVLKELLHDHQFLDAYCVASVRRTDGAGAPSLAGWYRKDFLDVVRRTPGFAVEEN